MLKRYRKKGADKASKLLIEAISSRKNGDTSLLDVGGGVGTIQIAMLTRISNLIQTSRPSGGLERLYS